MGRSRWLIPAGVLILVVQAIASYTLRRESFLPAPPPLATYPVRLGNWMQVHDGVVEPEVLQMLGPDDSLVREYAASGAAGRFSLFVAYYRTQLRAKNAHDPKVCLPGSGWNPRDSKVVTVAVPGTDRKIPVNYYRIARGGSEAIVIYWFQTHNGVYTFEQQLRAHRVLDSIVDNRTDMALVRIIVPIMANPDMAFADALQITQLVYPQMLPYFPPKEKAGS